MPVKAWDSITPKDGTSTVRTEEVKTCVTTIHQRMMMPSFTEAIGTELTQETPTSILPLLREKLLCRTQRVMQDGAVAVFSSSTTPMMATPTTSAIILRLIS